MLFVKKLTKREKEVLHLISYEYKAYEIANLLHISQHTVISHRRNICEKIGASNTAGLVRRGFELGLLTTGRTAVMEIA